MVDVVLSKVQDKYFLTNNEATPVDYTLKRLVGCTQYFTIFEDTLLAGAEVEITFTQDGEYQVFIVNAALEELTLDIKFYPCLLSSLIDNIYYSLCDCDCECTDCAADCGFLLMTQAKMQAYKRLINPEGQDHFDVVYATTKCLIEKSIYCSVTEEIIRGSSTYNENLIKQMLALDYLALYYYEYFIACLTDDKQYITDKFKAEQIFCCISSLGIDIEEIKAELTLLNA